MRPIIEKLLSKTEDNWSEYDGYLNYKDKSLAGSQTKASRLSLTNRDAKKYLESLIQLDESTESPIGDADNLDKAYKFIEQYIS